MDVEQGLLKGVGVEGLVERFVVLIAELAWLLGPGWAVGVDDVGYFFGFPLCLFAFGCDVVALFLLAANNGYAHKSGVLFKEFVDFKFLEEFLRICVDVKNDVGSAVLLLLADQAVLGRTVAGPQCTFCLWHLPASAVNFNLGRNHKARVKTQSKVTNHSPLVDFAFVGFDKLGRA